MNAIRIRRLLDSDTLHLPELEPLIGKTVEIIVLEEASRTEPAQTTGDWKSAERAARELRDTGYDFDAWRVQRQTDLKHADDHLP